MREKIENIIKPLISLPRMSSIYLLAFNFYHLHKKHIFNT